MIKVMNQKLAKFLDTANEEALKLDDNTKIGAILISGDEYRILSYGHNENPDKYNFIEHAERNAIYKAAKEGISLDKSIMITTLFPCIECIRAIICCGCSILITKKPDSRHNRWSEDWKIALQMLDEGKIVIIYLDKS